jgi:hypothetical protein
MRQVAWLLSCCAYKRGDALKRADAYGRALKSITEFRYFECGTNTETLRGRSCSIFGACLTFSSSIVTSTQQNAPSRRGIVVPHAPLDLNCPNRRRGQSAL